MNGETFFQETEVPEVTVETFRPLYEGFFDTLTPHQMTLLIQGKPDEDTKTSLTRLVSNVIEVVSKTLMEEMIKTNVKPVSKDHVLSNMGDSLPQSLAQVLGVTEEVRCKSSHTLTGLVAREVTRSVNSALSLEEPPKSEPKGYVTPACRIKKMVRHAKKMIQKFTWRMQRARQQPPPGGETTEVGRQGEDLKACQNETVYTLEFAERRSDEEEEMSLLSFNLDMVIAPGPVDEPGSGDAAVLEQKVPTKMEQFKSCVRGLVSTLVLRAASSELNEMEIEEITARLFDQVWADFQDEDIYIPPEKFVGLDEAIYEDLCATFCSSHTVIVYIELNNEVASLPVVRSIRRHLMKAKSDNHFEMSVMAVMDQLITRAASEAHLRLSVEKIYDISSRLTAKLLAKIEGRDFYIPHKKLKKLNEDIYKKLHVMFDGPGKSMFFLSCDNPVVDDKVISSIQKYLMGILLKKIPEEHPRTKEAKFKLGLNCLCQSFAMRVADQASLCLRIDEIDDISLRLFNKLWAKVEGEDFHIPPEKFQNLEKAIYKALKKVFGSPEMLLRLLKSDDAASEEMVNCIIRQLLKTEQKEPSPFGSFFSCLGGAVRKPFGRGDRVAVV